MNRNIIIRIVIFIGIVIFSLYFAFGFSFDENITSQSISQTPTNILPQESEDHMSIIDDGATIMVMGGQMNPSVLYSTPGANIALINHETNPLSIIAEDNSFETEVVPSGEEISFVAPDIPGLYKYHSSSNPSITGTIVIEE